MRFGAGGYDADGPRGSSGEIMTGATDHASLRLWRSLCLGDAMELPHGADSNANRAGADIMNEPELGEDQVEQLAQMIYDELDRQIDRGRPNNSAIIEAGSLRTVLIEGRIDLVRVAAALAKRCGLRMPEIETVADRGARSLPRS